MHIKESAPKKGRFLFEFGPLLLFFGGNLLFGIYVATAILVAATLLALMLSWHLDRHFPKMAALGGGFVVFFGGLTILMADDFWIKIKPTAASLAMASVILLGFLCGRNPLRAMMLEHLPLPAESKAWRDLTFSFIAMMLTIAGANEWAWRNLSTEQWASFKVFGLTGISLGFGVVIMAILHRYQHEMPDDTKRN